MSELQALIDEARALGSGDVPRPGPAESEVSRVMEICNACRYCEGFCAVFPAMTRRLEFAAADVHYLANLCHNCGACLHACQYAPPHEFGVNVPQAMARVRVRTYAAHAWPAAFGRAYAHNGLVVALALAFGLSLFLVLALVRHGTWWGAPSEGSFYAIFPHGLMVSMFLPVFAFALLALAVGVRRFWTGAPPVIGIVKMSQLPFRFEAKAILVPSAEMAGIRSSLGSVVSCVTVRPSTDFR